MAMRKLAGGTSDANTAKLLAAGLDLLEEGIAIFDRELILLSRNVLFCNLRGYPLDVCQPGATMESLLRFNAERGDYAPEDLDESIASRMEEIARFKEREVEYQVPNGPTLHIRYQPIAAEGLLLTCRDITDIRRAEAALRKSENRYAMVTEAATEGIYDWDTANNVLYVSPRLNRIFDFKDGDLKSEEWNARVHPEDYDRYRGALRSYFKGETDRLEVEYRIRDQRDRYRWVRDHAIAERDDGERAIRLVGAVADITEEKQAQEALRESEERYAAAMNAIGEGAFDWKPDTGEFYFSPRMHAAVGLPDGALKTPGDWAKRTHPDDADRFRDTLVAVLKGETERFFCEYRYRSGDNTWHWLRQQGAAIRGEDGRAHRFVGSVIDITDERKLAAQLEDARNRLTEAIEAIDEGFVLYDAEDRLVTCNGRFRDFYKALDDIILPGLRFEDFLRADVERRVFPEEYCSEAWLAERLKQRGAEHDVMEAQLKDGRWVRVSEQRKQDGGLVTLYTDISAMKHREEELAAAHAGALQAQNQPHSSHRPDRPCHGRRPRKSPGRGLR